MLNIETDMLIAGRYRLKKKLGQGGFASVFLATDQNFERDVALKLIDGEGQADFQSFFATFRREARVAARLLHPNILDVYDYGQVEQLIFLAMPYAGGGTLAARLAQTGPLDFMTALVYFQQVVTGLAYAHSQNIIHRDLKPQNLLLFEDDQLVIADFGLAKLLARPGNLTSTQVSGTPLYMAPEQWSGRVGKPTDIYALGIILYQMLAGQPPFRGATQADLYRQHLEEPLPDIGTGRPALPLLLPTFLADLTAKDPASRPPITDLKPLLDLVADPTATSEQYQTLRDKLTAQRLTEQPTLVETPTELLGPTNSTQRRSQAATIVRRPADPARRLKWVSLLSFFLVLVVLVQLVVIVGLSANRAVEQAAVPVTEVDVTYNPTAVTSGGSGYGTRLYSFRDGRSQALFDDGGGCIEGRTLSDKRQCRRVETGLLDPKQSQLPFAATYSPDGRHAVLFKPYDETQGVRSPLAAPVTGGGLPTPTTRPELTVRLGKFSLYRTSDNKEVLSLDGIPSLPSGTYGVPYAYSPDSHWLALLGQKGQLYLVDVANEKLLDQSLTLENPARLKIFQRGISSITHLGHGFYFSPNSRFLSVFDYRTRTEYQARNYLYDLESAQTGGKLTELKPILISNDVLFSSDAKRLIALKPDGEDIDVPYHLYDLSGPQLRHIKALTGILTAPPDIQNAYFAEPDFLRNGLFVGVTLDPDRSPDNKTDTAVLSFDATDGKPLATITTNGLPIFNHSGTLSLNAPDPEDTSGGTQNQDTITFVDTRSGKTLGTVTGIYEVLGFSFDDKILITRNKIGLIELYDPTTYKKVGQLDEQFPLDNLNSRMSHSNYWISTTKPLMITKNEEGLSTMWQLHP